MFVCFICLFVFLVLAASFISVVDFMVCPEITVKPGRYRIHVTQLENPQGKIIYGAEHSP